MKKRMAVLLVDENRKQQVDEESGMMTGGVGDTHQGFIHCPVEPGNRVGPNVPVIAPANLAQPALTLEPALRMVMMRIIVVMMVRLPHAPPLRNDVQEVLLHAALSREGPFPASGQCAPLHRALTVDDPHVGPRAHPQRADPCVRMVPPSVSERALLLAAAVKSAVGALGGLSATAAAPARTSGSPLIYRGVTRRGALPLQPPDALAGRQGVRLPRVLVIGPRAHARSTWTSFLETQALTHDLGVRVVLCHLRDAVEPLVGA